MATQNNWNYPVIVIFTTWKTTSCRLVTASIFVSSILFLFVDILLSFVNIIRSWIRLFLVYFMLHVFIYDHRFHWYLNEWKLIKKWLINMSLEMHFYFHSSSQCSQIETVLYRWWLDGNAGKKEPFFSSKRDVRKNRYPEKTIIFRTVTLGLH